jgi:hypothetical protein
MQGIIRMSTRSRREYFSILRERYRSSGSKSQQTQLIDEGVANTGLHRKSVIRALGQKRNLEGGPPQLGRPRKYSSAAVEWLKRLYRASEYACSDKLKTMIPTLLSQWKGPVDVEVIYELQAMSPATMDRYLRKYRNIERRRRNTGTRPGSRLFKQLIPLKSLGNIAPSPGHLQADTVAHGGDSTAGEFIWSLTLTDEKVGWTENRAFFGKYAKNCLPAIESAHQTLPFDLLTINVDNGSEFLNHRVYEYFKVLAEKKVIPFPMSRSRPYRKNDNSHVEQKNWTSVRQLFGYDRLEHKELVPLMNEIYRLQNLISNFFIPQYKLKSKVRIGAKIKKTYDGPKTPYQRLLEDPTIAEEQKQKLRETYAKLNYFDLQAQREELLAHFEKVKKELDSKKRANPSSPLLTASQ